MATLPEIEGDQAQDPVKNKFGEIKPKNSTDLESVDAYVTPTIKKDNFSGYAPISSVDSSSSSNTGFSPGDIGESLRTFRYGASPGASSDEAGPSGIKMESVPFGVITAFEKTDTEVNPSTDDAGVGLIQSKTVTTPGIIPVTIPFFSGQTPRSISVSEQNSRLDVRQTPVVSRASSYVSSTGQGVRPLDLHQTPVVSRASSHVSSIGQGVRPLDPPRSERPTSPVQRVTTSLIPTSLLTNIGDVRDVHDVRETSPVSRSTNPGSDSGTEGTFSAGLYNPRDVGRDLHGTAPVSQSSSSSGRSSVLLSQMHTAVELKNKMDQAQPSKQRVIMDISNNEMLTEYVINHCDFYDVVPNDDQDKILNEVLKYMNTESDAFSSDSERGNGKYPQLSLFLSIPIYFDWVMSQLYPELPGRAAPVIRVTSDQKKKLTPSRVSGVPFGVPPQQPSMRSSATSYQNVVPRPVSYYPAHVAPSGPSGPRGSSGAASTTLDGVHTAYSNWLQENYERCIGKIVKDTIETFNNETGNYILARLSVKVRAAVAAAELTVLNKSGKNYISTDANGID
jgi:hypothetical protein